MLKGILNILLFYALVLGTQPLAAQNLDTTVEVIYPPVGGNSLFDRIDKKSVQKITPRKVADSLVLQLKQDEAFWYANFALQQKETQTQSPSFIIQLFYQKWFKILLWILVFGSFAVLVAWYLMGINPILFRRKPTALTDTAPQTMPHDIFLIPYDQQIANAVQKKDFAQAVRLHYLQTLQQLTAKNKIRYEQDRTNSEYLAQLHQTDLYTGFFRLTRTFEYIWYGHFQLTEASFVKVEKDFKTFNQQLAS